MTPKQKFKIILLTGLLPVLLLTSCSGGSTQEDEKTGNLAVVISIDEADKKIILYEPDTKDKLVLSYSGGTGIENKYGKQMSMGQVSTGEIVEIDYKKGTQKLNELKVSSRAWEYDNVSNLTLDQDKSLIQLGNKNYHYDPEKTQVFSGGFSIDIKEVDKVDELTVRGVGNTVYSVDVVKGHGYIKLQNTDYFEGGLVEVGTKSIQQIKKDMVIIAGEGSYTLTAAKDGIGGSQDINVLRNEEVVVDISQFQQQAVRIGSIEFSISPDTARLYVDGTKKDYNSLVTLSYGNHLIKVIADGYTSYTENLMVDSIYQTKEITLEVSEEKAVQEETTTASGSYLINVPSPQGAEVYFDGVLKGKAPVSFEKVTGTHTIILRKTGYENKSYTVYVSSDNESVTFSFPDMTASDN